MLHRLIVALAVLVALAVVALPAWIAFHRRDLPEVDDADLLLEVPEVPEEDDAYVWFRKAADAMVWEDTNENHTRLKAVVAREASDPKWVEESIRANERAFALVERGLAAPGIANPPFTIDSDEDPMIGYIPILTLVRLALSDSRRLARDGAVDASLDRALLGMRVGRKISEAASPQLVGMMIAVSMQRLSLAETEHLLRELDLTAEDAQRLARRLDGLRLDEDSWRRSWAGEYAFVRDLIEQHAREVHRGSIAAYDDLPGGSLWRALELFPTDYLFQPNRTRSIAAKKYRELGDRSRSPCKTSRDTAEPAEPPSIASILLTPNGAGRIGMAVAFPGLERFEIRRCASATRISLVQALAALHAYRGEHGTLPETLDALVPEYLPAVPEDRFDGEPIRWSRERATLYSVGDDFVDDGPPEAPSQTDEHAPAVRLPTAS